jgi:tetratricopeptide (TPR) repeat protein
MPICKKCGKENDILAMHLEGDDLLCEECFSPSEENVVVDSGITCAFCGGRIAPEESVNYGPNIFCGACYNRVTHYPIPGWVKLFALTILLVTVLGAAVNARYFTALVDTRKAQAAFVQGDVDLSIRLIDGANAKVRNNRDLLAMQSLYHGIKAYSLGQEPEALRMIGEYMRVYPEDVFIKNLMLYMQISQAFDSGNYRSMVQFSNDLLALFPDDPKVKLQYASSLACVYVSEGAQKAKKEAERLTAEVKAGLGGLEETARTDAEEYIERIEHRISEKKIISAEEYDKTVKGGNE